MNFFFEKTRLLKHNNLEINTLYKVYYYDQFKYIHFFEGYCLELKKVSNDVWILFRVKNKETEISFFGSSPLLVSVEKI